MAIKINVRFAISAQTGEKDAPRKIASDLSEFLFTDVVLGGINRIQENISSALENRVRKTVALEVSRLAEAMLNGVVGLPNNTSAPKGTLTVSESSKFSRLAGVSIGAATPRDFAPYRLADSGVSWAPLSKAYLKRKLADPRFEDKGRFEREGPLGEFLGDPERLTSSFGPIEVAYTPDKGLGRDSRGRFTSIQKSTSSDVRVTRPGALGRPSEAQFLVGKVRVSVFGRITPRMLPALLSGDVSDFRGDSESLIGLLPASVRPRLDHAPDGKVPYREVVEPFLSWFLTRAIPYAVTRRLDSTFFSRNEAN